MSLAIEAFIKLWVRKLNLHPEGTTAAIFSRECAALIEAEIKSGRHPPAERGNEEQAE